MEDLPSELGIQASTPSKSPSRGGARDNVTELSSNAKFRKSVIDNEARLETPKSTTIEAKRRQKRVDKASSKLVQIEIDDSEAKTTIQLTAKREEAVEPQADFSVSSKKKPGRQSGSNVNHGAEKVVKSNAEVHPKKRSR